jgi:hypothetical protein
MQLFYTLPAEMRTIRHALTSRRDWVTMLFPDLEVIP